MPLTEKRSSAGTSTRDPRNTPAALPTHCLETAGRCSRSPAPGPSSKASAKLGKGVRARGCERAAAERPLPVVLGPTPPPRSWEGPLLNGPPSYVALLGIPLWVSSKLPPLRNVPANLRERLQELEGTSAASKLSFHRWGTELLRGVSLARAQHPSSTDYHCPPHSGGCFLVSEKNWSQRA